MPYATSAPASTSSRAGGAARREVDVLEAVVKRHRHEPADEEPDSEPLGEQREQLERRRGADRDRLEDHDREDRRRDVVDDPLGLQGGLDAVAGGHHLENGGDHRRAGRDEERADQERHVPRRAEQEPNRDRRTDQRDPGADRDQLQGRSRGAAEVVDPEVERALEDDDRDRQSHDGAEGVPEGVGADHAEHLRTEEDPREDQEHDAGDPEAVGEDLGDHADPDDRGHDRDQVRAAGSRHGDTST
jgi:hypothetical protein